MTRAVGKGLLRIGVAVALGIMAMIAGGLWAGPVEAAPYHVVTVKPETALPSPDSLDDLQKQARSMRASMTRLETEMRELTAQWRAARTHVDEVNARLVQVRRDYERAERSLSRQRAVLEDRMIQMYKVGGLSWVDLVANSSTMTDAEVVLDFMKRLTRMDREEENEFERLTTEARRLEQRVESDREEANLAQAQLDARREAMDAKIAEREALLRDVVAEIKKILAEPERLMSSGGKVTQLTWARAFLKSLNMDLTVDNVAAIVAWEMAEGGHWYNTAHYNPLNTSQPMPGARTFNSHGVKIYNSWSQGLRASVITIRNGFYGNILAALRAGNDGQAVAAAVAASPWGTGPFTVRK